MRLATVEQSKQIEDLSQKVYGLTGEILMEVAGVSSAREIEQSYYPELTRGTIGIVCGPGNNGGDGLVVARHLHSAGHRDLEVFLTGDPMTRSSLFKIQLHRLELHGIKFIDLYLNPEKIEKIKSMSLLVDALFGIGLSRPLEGDFLKVVEMMSSSKVPIISLDCPSGLDCNRGSAEGAALTADMTLSFGLAKPGFFVGEGPSRVGRLRVFSLGFPHECLRGTAITHFAFTERLARRYLPKRKFSSNKTDHGCALIIAGQKGFWGAGILASSAAFRMGTGYVIWLGHETPIEELKQIPEVLVGHTDDDSIWRNPKISAVAIGSGLGVNDKTAKVIERLKRMQWPVVLDADAITTCVQYDLFPLPSHWVLTPHAGELSRITKATSAAIEADRFRAALEASEKTGAHVLLKGFRSVMAHSGRVMVINSGNSALAKAGTGDVLTGMIAGLLAQGVDVVQGTAAAAFIHGKMADEWVRTGRDKRTLAASDLKDHLPELMARISQSGLD